MVNQQAILHLENMKQLKGYDNTSVNGVPLADIIDDIIALLRDQKNQPDIVYCRECKHWIPGTITNDDDFIPPKCGKYKQMVGHSADDYCSLAEKAVK